MTEGTGVISSTDLMKKLAMAKKVMDKVETGQYETGHVNEAVLRSSPEELSNQQSEFTNKRPVNNPNVNADKINRSKLPESIKRAMIENPIPQISLNDTIDMNIIKGAKRLMEQENNQKKSPSQKTVQYSNPQSSNIDLNTIAAIVENTVRKVLDEKLNQILSAQETKSINESLVIKVGDSVFKGKIIGVSKGK